MTLRTKERLKEASWVHRHPWTSFLSPFSRGTHFPFSGVSGQVCLCHGFELSLVFADTACRASGRFSEAREADWSVGCCSPCPSRQVCAKKAQAGVFASRLLGAPFLSLCEAQSRGPPAGPRLPRRQSYGLGVLGWRQNALFRWQIVQSCLHDKAWLYPPWVWRRKCTIYFVYK